MSLENHDELRTRLNAETGRIGWDELAPHFARGVLVRVDEGLDLVEVAANFVENHAENVEAWLETGKVERATDHDAQRWAGEAPEFWAVVVAPWVLVQEIPAPSSPNEP